MLLYRTIAAGSGNPFLAQTLSALHNRIALIRFSSLDRWQCVTRSFTRLRALSEAIMEGDATLTERHCAELPEEVGTIAKHIVEARYQIPATGDDAEPAAEASGRSCRQMRGRLK